MNKIDITQISDASKFPIKKGTLEFLQNGAAEQCTHIVKGLIGDSYDPTKAYRLWGVQYSVISGPNVQVTAGALFINGEIYTVANFVRPGTSGVMGLVVNNYSIYADPVTMSDGSTKNIHNQRQMKLYGSSDTPPATTYDFSSDIIDMPYASAFAGITSGNSLTVTFEKHNYYVLSASPGGITITLSSANRAVGTSCKVYVQADDSGNAVTFAGTGTTYIAGRDAAYGTGDNFMIDIVHAGSDKFFITITQYEY